MPPAGWAAFWVAPDSMIVYGGGGVGLMRAMADTALEAGAHVHGVLPEFMNTVEHGHKNLSRLEIVGRHA